jgi:membrane protein DedA with SNARE-associated domain
VIEFAGWFATQAVSLDPGAAVSHWGYGAVFVLVILGNAGVPVPEEMVLVVAGFLVWRGQLRLDLVLAVGIVSAVIGDNLGYWVGRRFGRGALERHAHWILGHPERYGAMQAFVERRGALAVFVARFVPGLRFMAGPLAGALGLRVWPFLAGNVLGATVYVPTMVFIGWALGYSFGDYVRPLRRFVGNVEHAAIWLVVVAAAALLAWRIIQAARSRRL